MSNPIGTPGSLAAAQAVSYAKGQEVQNLSSSERKERERRLAQQLQQLKNNQQRNNQASASGKGYLA